MPNTTGPTQQLCTFDLLLPSTQLLTRYPLTTLSALNHNNRQQVSIKLEYNLIYKHPLFPSSCHKQRCHHRELLAPHHYSTPHPQGTCSWHPWGTGDGGRTACHSSLEIKPGIWFWPFPWLKQVQWGWCCSYLHELSRGQGQVSSAPAALLKPQESKGNSDNCCRIIPAKQAGQDKPKAFSNANTPVLQQTPLESSTSSGLQMLRI